MGGVGGMTQTPPKPKRKINLASPALQQAKYIVDGLVKSVYWAAFLVLWSAGCSVHTQNSPLGPPERMIPAMADTCGIASLTAPIGAHFTVLANQTIQQELRVLWPGQDVTAQIKPGRVNAKVTDQGRLLRLFCG
jgi:hypothetical protein